MFNLTREQAWQYVRIAIYFIAGVFGQKAFLDGSTGQMILVGLGTLFTLFWTAYSTRIAAKINELVDAEVITIPVAEKLKDVATDPGAVVAKVETKPVS